MTSSELLRPIKMLQKLKEKEEEKNLLYKYPPHWTNRLSMLTWNRTLKEMEPLQLLEYLTQNLSRQLDVGNKDEEILLRLSVAFGIRSEYKFFKTGFELKIPYDVMAFILSNMKERLKRDEKISKPDDLHFFILEAGLGLFRLVRNCYYRAGKWSKLRHFYRVVIPTALVVPPYYAVVSERLFKLDEKRLNVGKYMEIKLVHVWKFEDVDFQTHLFYTITRAVCFDYIHYGNKRRFLTPNNEPEPHTYVHQVAEIDTLSERFNSVGIINGFFMHLGLVDGLSQLDGLVDKYHKSIYTPSLIKVPPLPDMRLLMFHSAMEMIRVKYQGEYWRFALWFKINYMQDIRRTQIRGLIKALPIYQKQLRKFHYKFIEKMVGRPTRTRPTVKYSHYGEASLSDDDDNNYDGIKLSYLYNRSLQSVKTDFYDSDFYPGTIPNVLRPCVPAHPSMMKSMFAPVIFSWSGHKCYY